MTHNRETSLKACPLCAGQAIESETEDHLGNIYPAIRCSRCGLELSLRTEAELPAAWNTRTTPEAAPASPVKDEVERVLTEIFYEARLPGTRNGPITEPKDLAAYVAPKLLAALSPVNGEVERLPSAIAPFIEAAKIGVATYEAVKAANLHQAGLSSYDTVYVSAGTHAAESRMSFADWRRLAALASPVEETKP